MSPFRYRSVGLLPGRDGDIREIEDYARLGYGVGEIGLDRRFPDKQGQIERFRKGLETARKYDALVTVHSVGWLDVTLSLLREYKGIRFIFHSFPSSLEIAKEIEKLGGYISLSPRAVRQKSFSSLIHNTRFLIESDMPTGEEEEKAVDEFYTYLCSLLEKEITFPSIL